MEDIIDLIPFVPMPILVHTWRKLLEKEGEQLCQEQRQEALKLLPQIRSFMERTSTKESVLSEVKTDTLEDLQAIENLLEKQVEKVARFHEEGDLPTEIPTEAEVDKMFDDIPF